MSALRVAIIGCGARGRTYARYMSASPGRYRLVAGADPDASRVAMLGDLAPEGFLRFDGAEALLAEEKLADLAVVATQDSDHLKPTVTALAKGYDVLVEKPIAATMADIEEIDRCAREHGRKVVTCFVLRYTPFYQAVRSVVDSGRLGEIVSIRGMEGVEPWHQAHSFVRGHWSRTAESTPMIVAKCCHDMDIISWLVDSPVRSVSSYGGRSYFHSGNAPEDATARCTDGCPHCGTCPYDAHRYLSDKKSTWLPMVHPKGVSESDGQLLQWLRESPWGRCVYLCDNDAVDHQTTNIEFENGVTATFTMTAFDDGRRIEIFGTRGVLRGHTVSYRSADERLTLTMHHSPKGEEIPIPRAEGGHGGGDHGLIESLYQTITQSNETGILQNALQGHGLAFAAEEARLASGSDVGGV